MSTTRIPLHYRYEDDVRSLERTPSGNFRLEGRGFAVTVPAACLDLRIHRRSQPIDNDLFFGVVHVNLIGLNLSLHCEPEAIKAAHEAFPMIAFETAEVEVAHEL